MTDRLKNIIDDAMRREGWDKYTNNPADKGGPTKWGITLNVARAYGYNGDMQSLDYDTAFAIYKKRFWYALSLDKVAGISESLAIEMFDYGVNSGPARAGKALQRALNVLNRLGHDYPDIKPDGAVGNITVQALSDFASARGKTGLTYLENMVKSQRSVFLMEIAENNPSQEVFENGWQERATNV